MVLVPYMWASMTFLPSNSFQPVVTPFIILTFIPFDIIEPCSSRPVSHMNLDILALLTTSTP